MSECSVCQRPDRQAIDAALRRKAPGRNAIASQFGIARTTLSRHARHVQTPQEEEPSMEPVLIQPPQGAETPADQHEALRAELAALQRELGQQRARIASHERRFGEIEARVQALAGQVGSHGLIVATAQELLDLLVKSDDAWQTVDSLLSTSSLATHGVLHQFVAEKVERPRPLKYIRQ